MTLLEARWRCVERSFRPTQTTISPTQTPKQRALG
jgi:hypothetical protein